MDPAPGGVRVPSPSSPSPSSPPQSSPPQSSPLQSWALQGSAWLRAEGLSRPLAGVSFACLGVLLAWVYVSRLGQGLWEDGYFVKRFAYNYWQHGTFSWNVSDGPVYGMTSQTLQLLGAVLYRLAPDHVVLTLKAASTAALFAVLPVLAGFDPQHAVPALPDRRRARTSGALVCLVTLSSVIVIEATLTGLETALGLLMVAVSLRVLFRPLRRVRDALLVAGCLWGVYLTRPDAILIPGVLLAARGLFAALDSWRQRPRKATAELRLATLAGVALVVALGLTLGACQRYYGTPLPLPFYVKTHGLNAQDASYVAYFFIEKVKNVAQLLFFAAPLAFVAAHERSRVVLSCLAAALCFFAYHYLATIETMGYYSRFYLPGLIPLMAAAKLGYAGYQRRRNGLVCVAVYAGYLAAFLWLLHVDATHSVAIQIGAAQYVPTLVATGLYLLWPARLDAVVAVAVGLCLWAGAYLNFPFAGLDIETDEALLLRQIRPRLAFPGIERLRQRIEPRVIYHTDMGAPGLLFPEAKVVDLDGLLNEDVTLRGAHFEDLCQVDHPEAIYLPKAGYVQLRSEMLASPCFQDYRAVTPARGGRLYVRGDLYSKYQGR